ncbi:hypothetical protein VTK73DRAFT_1675 [Phialemonium thermophilum]|uniref:Uncharacterized protein n=1 Tax=Phialemonium thermophilum TaxID=223376 RepID=A0ABR3VT44_9PEZI
MVNQTRSAPSLRLNQLLYHSGRPHPRARQHAVRCSLGFACSSSSSSSCYPSLCCTVEIASRRCCSPARPPSGPLTTAQVEPISHSLRNSSTGTPFNPARTSNGCPATASSTNSTAPA